MRQESEYHSLVMIILSILILAQSHAVSYLQSETRLVRVEAKGLGLLRCHGADVKNPFVVRDLKIH